MGVRRVTAKLARPQMMTETAVPWARAVVGKISVGMSQIVASHPIPNCKKLSVGDLSYRILTDLPLQWQ